MKTDKRTESEGLNRARPEDADELLARLAASRPAAPPGLADRIMRAVPDQPEQPWWERLRALWPREAQAWLVPATAGAAAVLLVVMGLMARSPREATPERMHVAFEFHAPEAGSVELVGSFNDWRPGEIVLKGPDATGHWICTVDLPAGRHEYMFLVDGHEWVTDPNAPVLRPDGFGHENAVIDI